MKKRLVLVVGLGIFLTLGCPKKDEKKPLDIGNKGDYFPLSVGATWKYKADGTMKISTDELPIPLTINITDDTTTDKITKTEMKDNGKTYHVKEVEREIKNIPSNVGFEKEWLKEVGFFRKDKSMVYRYVEGKEALVYNFDLPPGSKLSVDLGVYKAEVEVISTNATVDVPAGTYKNCYQIRLNMRATIRDPEGKREGTVSAVTTEWFARGYGCVKRDGKMTYNFTIADVKMQIKLDIKEGLREYSK
jgi:hypothetical protein